MQQHTHILLATLGGQPQVVTFTLDLLLQHNVPISEVIVVHPKVSSLPRLHQSLTKLQAEFVGDEYQFRGMTRTMHFRSHVLRLDTVPLDDITDDEHADATLDTLHKLIVDLKRRGSRIHLSITGGRRLIALLAVSVAALHFDRHDAIWHIYTPEPLKEQAKNGALMHVAEDAGVHLIQGPFLSLGAYVSNLSDSSQSFRTVQEERRMQMDAQEHERCTNVVKETTPAQLKVLQAFSSGLRPQDVATRLSIQVSSVSSHTHILFDLCRKAWNIPLKEHMDYHFLQTHFADYFREDE